MKRKHHRTGMFLEILVNESQINFAVFYSGVFPVTNCLRAYAGGLDTATNTMIELKTWAFSFGGVCALCYLIYNVIMAFMEKKSWSDVGMALVYCSLAGGALYAGNWALELFK